MLNRIEKTVTKILVALSNLIPQSWEGERLIQIVGHRNYIGGGWDKIGKLQLNFLLEHGLTPSHCFLDIACGSLRGGVHFIDYLEPGNYLGIDKERKLIELAIEKELGDSVYKNKKPEFVISDRFEFNKFSKKPKFSIAQSLFTHLTPEDIRLCLGNLRDFVDTGHILFATFSEGRSSLNRKRSHSIVMLKYSKVEMEAFGQQTGWKASYIGDWDQPRGQLMMKYETC
jgi:hypothetical protein